MNNGRRRREARARARAERLGDPEVRARRERFIQDGRLARWDTVHVGEVNRERRRAYGLR